MTKFIYGFVGGLVGTLVDLLVHYLADALRNVPFIKQLTEPPQGIVILIVLIVVGVATAVVIENRHASSHSSAPQKPPVSFKNSDFISSDSTIKGKGTAFDNVYSEDSTFNIDTSDN